MPCLRMRYHAVAVYLGDGMSTGKTLVEGMAAVAIRAGDYKFFPFIGFTSEQGIGQAVKLANITAYTTETFQDPWIEYGDNAKLLGYFVPGKGVYCYLEDMKPIAWCDWP